MPTVITLQEILEEYKDTLDECDEWGKAIERIRGVGRLQGASKDERAPVRDLWAQYSDAEKRADVMIRRWGKVNGESVHLPTLKAQHDDAHKRVREYKDALREVSSERARALLTANLNKAESALKALSETVITFEDEV